jgi:orotidine-5'-phosphate decarboxylase
MSTDQRRRLVLALDVESVNDAIDLVNRFRGLVGMFKVGSQLFTAAGPQIVERIVEAGAPVFLDLKFHDIPQTVAGAAAAATRLGVKIFNVHATGGSEMMKRAAESAQSAANDAGIKPPIILGVTVLTSSDARTLQECGVDSSVEEQVKRLAGLCSVSGMDGVVASPREIQLIRSTVQDPRFVILTPGVRPAGSSINDQKRVMTPAEAIHAGADFIVVGRAILAAPYPEAVAGAILAEMEAAV